MALTSHFNLQAKNQTQLKGLYAELFNKLADKNTDDKERKIAHAMLYQIKQILEH